MSSTLDQIVETLLYEGFILYPYRPSARKNRQRFTFGRVYPQAYSVSEKGAERCAMQTECLLTNANEGELQVSVRFLHPLVREVGLPATPMDPFGWEAGAEPPVEIVPETRVDGQLYQAWQEAIERRVLLPSLNLRKPDPSAAVQFSFSASRLVEPIKNRQGEVAALLLRRQEAIEGTVEVAVQSFGGNLAKVTVRVLNQTPITADEIARPESVLLRTMASTHTVMQLRGAEFSSLLDPLPEHKAAAEQCLNLGTWPVLVGDPQKAQRDTMLSSPIILYDYPQIAPESPGSSFDGTEVDELLALCVQALTDDEKQEVRAAGEQARQLLERTESLSRQQWLKLHGARRDNQTAAEDFFATGNRLAEITIEGVAVRIGDRVRLRPQGRADIFDLALSGRLAQVESIEQDFENRVHVAVVLDSDPGKDLGLLRQPGHRFFFGVDELELVDGGSEVPVEQEVRYE